MPLNPNLSDPWIQNILTERKIVPNNFRVWYLHNLHKIKVVPQQEFYSQAWKYYHRFGTWPSSEICECILEKVLENG